MKKNLLILVFFTIVFHPLFSQTLYSSTEETGVRFNPGLGSSGTPVIVLDDVSIPAAQVVGSDSIQVTNVKFGIRRLPDAPALTVSFYFTSVNSAATSFDNVITTPPVLLGSIDLPANGSTGVTAVVSLGDSVSTLFSMPTDTGNLFFGYHTFFLGLSISNTDDSAGLNGWRVTLPGPPGSENDDIMWVYDVDDPDITYATYFGGDPAATFYLEVFGRGFTTVPVTLTTFNAQVANGVNLLNWTTEQESNTSHFNIEHSTDGTSFSKIGQVAAVGNSSILHHYNFTDLAPEIGDNYYRLRIVDKDNSSKLSEVRRLKNAGTAVVTVYPNPVADLLNISINTSNATEGKLSITDISGKIVYLKTVKLQPGNSVLPVQVDHVPAGSYILKVQLNNDIIVKKFNKQ